ncbi:hypothetical protein SAMN02949497_1936 [Methylomagnum ishizawai]|uniref:Uncharacterized protein n=1 Tax=Methylomagnum ishizawai TaxID=1760988 RepID=A0A1Y6D3S7_9GAMM|nr:hypothetical protein [Methylomagnum ishizawai]SMF94615.1 hypothetical protein SAMN02949497_1936 [Methylomagnum ishizawai]
MCGTTRRSEQKESPYQAALADIAENKLHLYNRDFKPLENQYISRVDNLGSPFQTDRAGGLAESGVVRALSPKLQAARRDLGVSGVGAGSGAAVMRSAALRSAGGDAVASAGVGAEMGQRTRYLAGLINGVGLGNGQAGQADASMAALAGQEASRAQSQLEYDTANDLAVGRGVGTVGGLALASALK